MSASSSNNIEEIIENTVNEEIIEEKHCLTKKGVSIPLSEFKAASLLKLKRQLTIRIKVSIPGKKGYIKETKNYDQQGKNFYIPRFRAIALGLQFKNKLKQNDIKINYNYKGALFDFQVPVMNLLKDIYSKESVEKGKGGCVLKIDTGLGKSYIAAEVIHYIGKRALIIVQQINMAFQWIKLLNILFPDEEIGIYYGKKKVIRNITVAVSDSCNSERYGDMRMVNNKLTLVPITQKEFYESFDVVIFDEMHTYTGKTDRKLFTLAQCNYMMGLSASMTRENVELYDYVIDRIGPILDADIMPEVIENKVEFECDVKIIRFYGHNDYVRPVLNNDGVMTYMSTAKKLVLEHRRNVVITDETMELYKQGHSIFVLTIFRDHVRELYRLLIERINELKIKNVEVIAPELEMEELNDEELEKIIDITDINNIEELEKTKFIQTNDISHMMGGSSVEEVEIGIGCQIIISTYSYSGTGISIDNKTALIVAAPIKKNSMQVNGRIFRSNKKYNHIRRKIIDICDERSPLKSQLQRRIKDYRRRECNITYA